MIQAIFYVILTIYLTSALAIYIWHKLTEGTSHMSWVGGAEIFLPVYNTITALALWSEFNPFDKED